MIAVTHEHSDQESKNRIEALLFACADGVLVETLAKLCGITMIDEVHRLAAQLKEDYLARESPLMVMQQGELYKLSVSEKYLDIIQHINHNTELPTAVMETLAVIAWRAPCMQSDIVKIRSTKAYDHIAELLEKGFIARERHGRSYMIKITQKFYEYFDIPSKEAIAEVFKEFESELRTPADPVQTVIGFNPTPAGVADADMLGSLQVYGDGTPPNSPAFIQGMEVYGDQAESSQVLEPAPETVESPQQPVDQSPPTVHEQPAESQEQSPASAPQEEAAQPQEQQPSNAMQFDVPDTDDVEIVPPQPLPENQPQQDPGFAYPPAGDAPHNEPAPPEPTRAAQPGAGPAVRTAESYIDIDVADEGPDESLSPEDAVRVQSRVQEILTDEDSAVTEEGSDGVRLGPYPVEQARYELEGVKLTNRAKDLMGELTGEKNLSFMTEKDDDFVEPEELDTESEIDSKEREIEAGHSKFGDSLDTQNSSHEEEDSEESEETS